MGKKAFLVDVAYCNGCHNCQVACKDEHCGADWSPYAKAQPETGQFWCKVEEQVHGSGQKVNITYLPVMGAQDEAVRAFAPEACMDREDGLVVLDPAKCEGRRDIAEKFEGVFWNEELNVCQGCTGCAHLLDDGWDEPRCVDACATGALRFVDEADIPAEAERLAPASKVYYLNLPKRWVAGEVYDEPADEVAIGVCVNLRRDGEVVASTQTDEFGDFWFRQVEAASYTVEVVAPEGYIPRTVAANALDADVNVGAIALNPMVIVEAGE